MYLMTDELGKRREDEEEEIDTYLKVIYLKNGIVCAGRRAMYILEVMRILLEVRDKKHFEMGVDVLLYAPLC